MAVGLRVGVDVTVGVGEGARVDVNTGIGVPHTGDDIGGAGSEAAGVISASGGNDVEIHTDTVAVGEAGRIAADCLCAVDVSAAE